ncbi:STAS/SEC14 domain-containing protein [Aliikangiella coralliicola]|nr:STAS/SEC14 domain-containing protein [Aliikangiella coralliicola]
MIVRISGCLNNTTVVELIDAIQKTQDRKKNYHRLYDLTQVELEITIKDFDFVLSHAWEKFNVAGVEHRVAFVAQDEFTLMLLDLYKTQSRKYAFHYVEYFENESDAIQWLQETD